MHHKNTDIETSLQSDTIHFYGTQPQHFGDYDGANIHHQEHNRLCGDDITVHIQLRDGIIERWTFTGHASMITIACSGLFGDIVQGVDCDTIFTWNQSTMREKTGVTVSPRRERAQVIALLATRNALHEYLGDGKRDDFSDVL